MSDNFYKYIESKGYQFESPMAMALRIWKEQEQEKENRESRES